VTCTLDEVVDEVVKRLRSTPTADELITEPQLMERYGFGKNSADSRSIPRTRAGRRNVWRVRDVEAALVASPVVPRAKHVHVKQTDDDPIASLIASGTVVARGAR